VILVASLIDGAQGGPPIKVDWRVGKSGAGYKIVDVIVEGISMAVTERQEFASVIQRNNGQIEALLKSAVELDPKFSEAQLQMGNLYSDQKKYSDSVPHYEAALALNADLADAHYRLGQAYVHLGKRDEAQQQLQIYQKLRAQHLAVLEKQRAEIKQFVISEKGGRVSNDSGASPR